ncbi:MAG: glutamate--tRNA ligase [Firmicutes bacterium]|nr:glutamate--tRNA ligase [Bacillota bacterium]
MTVRLRYAPSPTGHLHIGGARTALFNYLYAKRHGGTFILRIEDTDLGRNVERAAEEFAQNLRWLGIEWDEGFDQGGAFGPYTCTERLPIYQQYVSQLKASGHAYDCFCTEEELAEQAQLQSEAGEMPHYSGKCRHLTADERAALLAEGRVPTVRLRIPENRTVSFVDMIRGELSFDPNSSGGDFRIVKSNGIPVYNFAVVIDDHLMEITHVVRGEEHISNTPRQLHLYEAFGWTPPAFGHVSLILGPDGRKLSKRDESIIQFIEQYKDFGYLPEAVFNFLALLGWSPEGEQELLSQEAIVAQFSLERLSKSSAYFDPVKLAWMNGQYIKARSADDLLPLVEPYLAPYATTAPWSADAKWRRELVSLYQEQLASLSELPQVASAFLAPDVQWSSEAVACLENLSAQTVLEALSDVLDEQTEELTADRVKDMIKTVQTNSGQKGKDLFMPIRAAVTGELHGRDLNRTLALTGRTLVIQRLQAALAFVRQKG